VLSDGRIHIGLHQRQFASPALTFVYPGIAEHAREFEARGIELAVRKTGEDVFNEIGFLDPSGQMIVVLEARTYSPPAQAVKDSLCGYFTEFSIPTADFDDSRVFWEALGFVAMEDTEGPYPRLPLTSDHLDIAFHQVRSFDQTLLVFRDAAMRERLARLDELGIRGSGRLPRGLNADANALLEAPEGTALLLLEGDS
jgi:hypothetical protein